MQKQYGQQIILVMIKMLLSTALRVRLIYNKPKIIGIIAVIPLIGQTATNSSRFNTSVYNF